MKSSPTPVWEDNKLESDLQRILNFTRAAVFRGCAIVWIGSEATNYVVRSDGQTEAGSIGIGYVRCVANKAFLVESVINTYEALGIAQELSGVEQVVEFHTELHSDPLG
jgi:hypothetical protein